MTPVGLFTVPTFVRRLILLRETYVYPQELLGCTFLMDTQEDGQRFRACIVECISDHETNVRCLMIMSSFE
jgi:hypothetical protein